MSRAGGLAAWLAVFVSACCPSGGPVPAAGSSGGTTLVAPVASPPDSYGYPQTALTPLAHEMTDFALAAIRGQPLPVVRFPLQPGERRVETGGQPAREPLAVVGFFIEAEAVFGSAPAVPGPTPGPGERRALEEGIFLCAHGIRVVQLRMTSSSDSRPLPAALDDLRGVIGSVATAARTGTVGPMLFGEAERPLLGSDALYREATEDLPSTQQLWQLRSELASRGEPTGYDLDDTGVIAREPTGQLVLLKMDLDAEPGGFTLSPRIQVQHMGN